MTLTKEQEARVYAKLIPAIETGFYVMTAENLPLIRQELISLGWGKDEIDYAFSKCKKKIPNQYNVGPDGLATENYLNKDVKILSEKQLREYIPKSNAWIVKNIIRNATIVVIGGKRSTLKTFLNLQMDICISQGLSFVNKFDTIKTNVLYIDKENGFAELQKRVALIKKGLKIQSDLNIYFLSESSLYLDDKIDIQYLRQIIKSHSIKIITVDSYTRFNRIDEDKAKETSEFIGKQIKPICEELDCTFVFIHHVKKGKTQGDEMDMFRGSSDLVNYADSVILVSRKGDSLIIKQLKNRSGKEVKPFQIVIDTDEETYFNLDYIGHIETKEDKICQVITQWFIDKRIKQFTFTQGLKFIESKKFKETAYQQALKDLQEQGIIKKGEGWRTPYIVSDDIRGYLTDEN